MNISHYKKSYLQHLAYSGNLEKRKEYIVDSSDLRKYQILGFEDYNHYVGYLATNGLNNLVPEFQILDNADHYGDF